jgi:hypothetical protein
VTDNLVARLRDLANDQDMLAPDNTNDSSELREAADRIEKLETALQRYVCWCKDVTATGAQVCTHGIPTTSLCGWEARRALEGKDD